MICVFRVFRVFLRKNDCFPNGKDLNLQELNHLFALGSLGSVHGVVVKTFFKTL